jgi:hypothetical protein
VNAVQQQRAGRSAGIEDLDVKPIRRSERGDNRFGVQGIGEPVWHENAIEGARGIMLETPVFRPAGS